jgi:hypothetical protein
VLTADRGKDPSLGGRKKSQWVEKQAGEEGNYHQDGWKRMSTALAEGGKECLRGQLSLPEIPSTGNLLSFQQFRGSFLINQVLELQSHQAVRSGK